MKQANLLIIEDVPEMGEYLRLILQECSWVGKVHLSQNLWEAELEISRHRPDLILLDEVIPGASIFDFLKRVLDDGLRVILITASETPDRRALPEGVQTRLIKPKKGMEKTFLEQIRGSFGV